MGENIVLSGGKAGPNRAKRVQTGPKSNKKCLTGPNMVKSANGPNNAKWGHMGLIFCKHPYFYEIKKLCLASQALRQKLAELRGFC